MPIQIILAWTEEDVEVIGRWAADLGGRPLTRTISVAKTALWLTMGTEADLPKARAYATSMGWQVFAYAQSVDDARDRAAREALKPLKASLYDVPIPCVCGHVYGEHLFDPGGTCRRCSCGGWRPTSP